MTCQCGGTGRLPVITPIGKGGHQGWLARRTYRDCPFCSASVLSKGRGVAGNGSLSGRELNPPSEPLSAAENARRIAAEAAGGDDGYSRNPERIDAHDFYGIRGACND